MRRLGYWFDRWGKALGLVTVGVLLGGVAGWWAGSYLACSKTVAGCEVRPDSVGAVGTWFGSIGTIAAVLTAVTAFRSDEKSRNEAARREALSEEGRSQLRLAEARSVKVECRATYSRGKEVRGYEVIVLNGADSTPIYRVQGHDFCGALKDAHEIPAGDRARTTRRAGKWTPPSPPLAPAEFERWCIDTVAVEFTMNGERWRIVGTDEAVRV